MYNISIDFEYNPLKSEQNRLKHGISFEEAKAMWTVLGVTVPARVVMESRFVRISIWKGKFYSCIYMFRKNGVRIISVRRSRKEEEKIYWENTKNEKKGEENFSG